MYLNNKEEIVIGKFMNTVDENYGKKMTLKWKDNSQIQGIFDSYIEDDSECDMNEAGYEEFWSFVFKAIDLTGNPPVYITEDEYFCINYKNFPHEIIADGKKIN